MPSDRSRSQWLCDLSSGMSTGRNVGAAKDWHAEEEQAAFGGRLAHDASQGTGRGGVELFSHAAGEKCRPAGFDGVAHGFRH